MSKDHSSTTRLTEWAPPQGQHQKQIGRNQGNAIARKNKS
jgi:hypothetical protein